jgi:hypothetical protein
VKRFLPSLLLSLGIVVLAPYVGVLRQSLFEAFPMGALFALGGALLATGGLALGFAFWRIRTRRLPRFLGLLATVLLVWGQNFGFGTADIEVNIIEKLHIVEYGLLAWWLYRALLHGPAERSASGGDAGRHGDVSLLLLPLFGVCLAGTLDETVQWLVATRTGDVRDIGLDVYSGACGVLFALCLEPPERFRWRVGRRPWVLGWGALALLGLGLFFSQAHLGYLIEDPEIGHFRSWHSRDELLRLQGQRAVSWRHRPPGRNASPWRLEDRYLTEAGWHSGHRQRNFELGYYYWALQANRILETYYAPYLDLEGFGRPDRRRYTPQVLQRVTRQSVVLDPRFYHSPVLQTRLCVWPSKPLFLGVLGAAVLSLLGLAVLTARSSAAARR